MTLRKKRKRSICKAPACFLAIALITSESFAPRSVQASPAQEPFDAIEAIDLRLASVVYRLAGSNAHLCTRTMPLTGMVLHSRGQYNKAIAESIAAEGGFPTPVAVELVLAGSPAGLAGLRPGDGIVSVNGVLLPNTHAGGGFDPALRDQAENLLTSLPPQAPIVLGIRRSGLPAAAKIILYPRIACRTRWEVAFDKATLALSDGKTIQVSGRFVQNENDDALAVIAAHELAHTALGHRESLEAAGVETGLLAAYGRSGKLVRAAEDDADRFSVTLLRNAGYDPGIAVKFWQGRGARYSGGILRSPTHASAKSRAKAIADEIARMNPSP